MADWTNVLDSAQDPDAPVTSEWGYAMRDNPIAIAEGAIGAPRVQAGAFQIVAGSATDPSAFPIESYTLASGTNTDRYVFATSGTVRVTATTSGTGNVQIFKNGAPIYTAAAGATISEVVSVSRSDTFWIRAVAGATITNIAFRTTVPMFCGYIRPAI